MMNPARRRPTIHVILAIGLIVAAGGGNAGDGTADQPPRLILKGLGKTEVAPHGEGNVYAPDVLVEGGLHRMWYGGQGRDGHDRIHLAESKDGKTWDHKGVVLDNGDANHVNDPSVVRVGGDYFMYYTLAMGSVVDEIALASSKNGVTWEKRGVVLKPGQEAEWDSFLVGRPSVLHENGTFKMWYDGRKDLPLGAPAEGVPKSPKSSRNVGYATSKDGIRWTKHPRNPVLGGDAGGVDVERVGDGYVLVYESHEGTKAATSADGISWKDLGLLVPRSCEEIDRHGHVTPMLAMGERGIPWKLYFGAARAVSWDRNSIAEVVIQPGQIEKLAGGNKSVP
jgi:Glycosyl hydrolases family 32 N-terminal domain